MMKIFRLITENLSKKEQFRQEYFDLIKDDEQATELRNVYLVQNEKMSDLIEYIVETYQEQLNSLMKKYNIGYEEMIELIVER